MIFNFFSRTEQDIANLLVECGISPSADSSLSKVSARDASIIVMLDL